MKSNKISVKFQEVRREREEEAEDEEEVDSEDDR